MKTLDTNTVLAIIKMLDNRANFLNKAVITKSDDTLEDAMLRAIIKRERLLELNKVKAHLQSYIEGQLNAVENQSTEQ